MTGEGRSKHFGMVLGLAVIAATVGARAQTVPLAIETQPPLATRPVTPAPVLVPQPSGPPLAAQAPAPVAPIVIPPGPGPVAVPEVPKPSPLPAPAQAPVLQSQTPPSPPPAETPKPAEPAPAPTPAAPPADGAKPAEATPPAGAPTPPPPAAPQPAPQATQPPAPPAAPKPVAVEIVLAAKPVLFVTGVTTWEKAEDKLGSVFDKLSEAAKKLGLEPTEGPLVEYIESDSDDVGFKAMLPLAAPPKADAKLPKGVKVGKSPAGRALEFRHDGPIDDLEEVYARIDDEMSRLGLEAKSILERYDVNALGSEEDRTVVDVWVLVK